MARELALDNPHLGAKKKACLNVGYDFRPFMNAQAGGMRTTAISPCHKDMALSLAAFQWLLRCRYIFGPSSCRSSNAAFILIQDFCLACSVAA
ncbi:hypothetical protein [Desulfosporosinus sp.]|uniref:hypothetical protein n=1 Tax=Desulfosporosinus sp. TaxID=157907 RepID=UPI00231733D7|nr:hypothetical protein [Desulfosporosinus sp.]MDA8220300.1 hypothetical protein [Desulfitobacterium hafniense]